MEQPLNYKEKITKNILKSRGANIDPCGAASKISAHEIYFELNWWNLVLCFQFSKQSWTNFRDERNRPYACVLQLKVHDWGSQKPLKD